MSTWPEGRAVVDATGAYTTTYGKTAHGLVRRSERYDVSAVLDPRFAGQDAGTVLDGRANGIPVLATLDDALGAAAAAGAPLTHYVVGVATDGGKLPPVMRATVEAALRAGLHVVCGLHQFLGEDKELAALAAARGVTLTDVRRPPHRRDLHFFDGRIEQVDSLKVALLGTDSAVGKRTTAWVLVDAYRRAGLRAELVGTGQTAWLQGARFSLVLDSLVNDFVAGEIEHAVWSCWRETSPDVIVLEGQGSLMNPAYPGGHELLAAGRPDAVILQHAPARREYDGFPGYPLHDLPTQIRAVELLSGRPVVGVTVNHEDLAPEQVPAACAEITAATGLPAVDALRDGMEPILEALAPHLAAAGARRRTGGGHA